MLDCVRSRRRPLLVLVLAALAALAGCHHFVPAPLSLEEGAQHVEARSLAEPALREFIEAQLGHPMSIWPRTRWDLGALTLAACHFHPDLAVARADWQLARAGVETAGARPNPTLAFAPEFVSNAATAVSPWITAVHFDWPIETAGKRGHRVTRAENLAQSARLGLHGAAWRLRGELRSALVELDAADRRAAHLGRERALQDELLHLLEARLADGAVSRAILAPQHLAAVQAAFDEAEAVGRRGQARARVAAALGVPVHALSELELLAPPQEPAEADALRSAEARRFALVGRADVLASLNDYAASESALQLEVARQYPDLHLNTGYQYDQGANKWALGLSLELPLLNRNEGPIAEAEAQRARAAAQFESLQVRVIAEVEAASAAHASALEQLAQTEALVSERTALYERSQRAFELGAYDRPALIAAQLELERTEGLRDEARARLLDAEARLEQATQPPLDLLTELDASPKERP